MAGCIPETNQPSIRILVASSARYSTERAVRQFERDHADTAGFPRILVVSASSSSLAQQIIAGAPADIFISANQKWSKAIKGRVSRSGLLVANRLILATNKSNQDSLRSIEQLTSSSVETVASATERVPVGYYAAQVLERLEPKSRDAIQSKLVFAKDSSALVAWLESNEVDAAFVYATDAQRSSKIAVVTQFDDRLHEPIDYSVSLLNTSGQSNHEFSDQLFRWLQSHEAKAIYEESGFLRIN